MKFILLNYRRDGEGKHSLMLIDDFNLDTIRSLSFYNEEYDSFYLIEGEYVDEDNKELEVTKTYKRVYFGKRISNSKVKSLICQNPKYSVVMDIIEESEQHSEEYDEEDIYDDEEYVEADSLFVAPDNIHANVLSDEIDITIEEFDPNIKLDYRNYYENFKRNSIFASLYASKYALVLSCFTEFFSALDVMEFYISDLNKLFEIYKFDFTALGYTDLKEIKQLLYYFNYFSNLDERQARILKEYKKYLIQSFGKGRTR